MIYGGLWYNYDMTDAGRFWSRVSLRDGGCLEWQGFIASTGYGTFHLRGKNWLAHRAAYDLGVGPIPEGMQVCHTCDNRKCVNLDHLFLGTQSDNMIDCLNKGRFTDNRLEKHGMARFTNDQVLLVRRRIAAGEKQSALAKEYGVHPTTISNIKSGKNWGALSFTE